MEEKERDGEVWRFGLYYKMIPGDWAFKEEDTIMVSLFVWMRK